MAAVQPSPQPVADLGAQRSHVEAEKVTPQRSIAEPMPMFEELFSQVEQVLADLVGQAVAITEGLPVAAQMSPAGLPQVEVVVRAKAVADDHALEILAEQGVGTVAVAVTPDQENAHLVG